MVDARLDLLRHLARVHGLDAESVEEIDRDVLLVTPRSGQDRVVRVFPLARPLAAAEGDAEILQRLEDAAYPAERADMHPVSVWRDRPLLVTRYIDTVPRTQRREAIRAAGGLRELGRMLGDLQRLPALGATARPGGAWHHLAEGRPSAELEAASRMVGELAAEAAPGDRDALHVIARELADVDAGDGLPESFLHPDFVLANVVAATDGRMVIVDWTGAGVGPRLWPLAFLLWAEGVKDPRRAALVAAGYRSRIHLEPDEADRLPAMMRARHLVFLAWNLREGTTDARSAAAAATRNRTTTAAIVDAVRGILGGSR
jgi:Ser/Thr protein kinase RdoA (MazF antagonist)